MPTYNDDVWASDEDNDRQSKIRNRLSKSATRHSQCENYAALSHLRVGSARIDTSARNILTAQSIQPSEFGLQNDLRQRLQKAKSNANELSKSSLKLLNKRKALPPPPPC